MDSTDYYPLMTDLVAAGGASGFSATAYQYDAENRLIAIGPTAKPADGMLKFTFAYDYLHRRIRKQLYTYNGTTSTWDLTSDRKWIYAGWHPQEWGGRLARDQAGPPPKALPPTPTSRTPTSPLLPPRRQSPKIPRLSPNPGWYNTQYLDCDCLSGSLEAAGGIGGFWRLVSRGSRRLDRAA